jgi:hypothetical protein
VAIGVHSWANIQPVLPSLMEIRGQWVAFLDPNLLPTEERASAREFTRNQNHEPGQDGHRYQDGRIHSPVRQAHPFDRLRMTLSGVEWVRAPSKVEGLARPLRSGGIYHVLNRGDYRADVLMMSAVKGLSARMASTSTP